LEGGNAVGLCIAAREKKARGAQRRHHEHYCEADALRVSAVVPCVCVCARACALSCGRPRCRWWAGGWEGRVVLGNCDCLLAKQNSKTARLLLPCC